MYISCNGDVNLGSKLKPVRVQKFWLNLQLALVLASFWILWLLPVVVVVSVFLMVTVREREGLARTVGWFVSGLAAAGFVLLTRNMWKAAKAVPEELNPKEPPGKPLREGDAPELFALAAKLREATGIRQTVEVWSDLSPVVSAVAYSAHLAAETKIALRNGLAALAVLSRAQLETLLRYHLTILTFSPRLVSLLLKARMMADGSVYFVPYIWAFEGNLRKVERYARKRAALETGASIEASIAISQEATRQFNLFWATDMDMFLHTGHLMPVAEGFARYWRRLRTEHGESVVAEEDLALGFLRSPHTVESQLTVNLLKQHPTLERAQWEQGGPILLAMWEHACDAAADRLVGLRVGGLCELMRDGAVQLGAKLFEKPGRLHDPDELRIWTGQTLASALAVALSRAGWRFLYTGAGSRMEFGKDEMQLSPIITMQGMITGKMRCEEWAEICERYGIAALPLSRSEANY